MRNTRLNRSRKGFTLLELIIVIAIIIVLVVLLAIVIFAVLNKNRASATESRMRSISESVKKLDANWMKFVNPRMNSASYSEAMMKDIIGDAKSWKDMSEEQRGVFLAFALGPGTDSWAKGYTNPQPYDAPLDEQATKGMLMNHTSGFTAFVDGWNNALPISYIVKPSAGGEMAALVFFSAGKDGKYHTEDDVYFDMTSNALENGSVKAKYLDK